MENEIIEMGICEKCGADIKLTEAWKVTEKFYCQNCFDSLDL